MFLLDTNVVSELRKAPSGKADPQVIAWAKDVPAASLHISAITVMELEIGVLRMERKDAIQGGILRKWLENQVWTAFDGRILAIDKEVALRCGRLHVPDPRADRDSILAATALVHGLTVVTRNVSDFDGTGVQILNPWLKR